MAALTCLAPAKINLFLEVLGKRQDGFHELVTLMHTLDLADELSISASDCDHLHFTCNDPSLPTDESNLVIKAALALREAAGVELGAEISLRKAIPHGAGLGGGSSDAATTLAALNMLWGLQMPSQELAQIAAGLGSDVAFFLSAPAALCRGRGEIVDIDADLSALERVADHLVLVFPAISVSTPKVYQSGAIDLVSPRIAFPRVMPFNRLQAACLEIFPEVSAAIAGADAALAGFADGEPALLCGSGSSFAYFWPDHHRAQAAAQTLREALPPHYRIFNTQLSAR